MSHAHHNAIAPFSERATIPVFTTRAKQGPIGVYAIREAQACDGLYIRAREIRQDELGAWCDPQSFRKANGQLGYVDTPVAHGPTAWRNHGPAAGFTVSGYTVDTDGRIVQEMILATIEDDERVVRGRCFVYTTSPACEAIRTRQYVAGRGHDTPKAFLTACDAARERLRECRGVQVFDAALQDALELDAHTIQHHWDASIERARVATLRTGFAPHAPLAF